MRIFIRFFKIFPVIPLIGKKPVAFLYKSHIAFRHKIAFHSASVLLSFLFPVSYLQSNRNTV